MSDRITVGVVSWYSTQYIVDLFKSLLDKTADSELQFIVCDNTGGRDTDLYTSLNGACEIIPFNPIVPQVWKREQRFGSYAHGLALNMLLSKIATEYCLFIDPDCLILAKGWDIACKTALSGQNIAIGAPYHTKKISKYHTFPSPIFTFFKTDVFRKIQADWTPYMLPLRIEVFDQIRRGLAILGVYLGEHIIGKSFYTSRVSEWMRKLLGNSSKDTGWRIFSNAKKYNYTTTLFTPAVENQQLHPDFQLDENLALLIKEFELFLWQSSPIVAHYYGNKHRQQGNVLESTKTWKILVETVYDVCSSVDIQTTSQNRFDHANKPFT